jgi:erythromycin esterase
MADTLTFLANQYYPDEKIIVWAAAFHTLRNKHLMSVNGIYYYAGYSIMGDYLDDEFGDDIYSIAAITYEGESQYATGYWYCLIPPAEEGTLSWYFYQLGGKYYFLDMKSLEPNSWVRENMRERAIHPTTYWDAPWPEIFDAFVYIKVTSPCVPIDERRR